MSLRLFAIGVLLTTMLTATISLGLMSQARWPAESRPMSTPRPKSKFRLATPAFTPSFAPEPVANVRGVARPVARPVPTYDATPIENKCATDGGDDCWYATFCHYDEGDSEGTVFYGDSDFERAHLAQHPRDYRTNETDGCRR